MGFGGRKGLGALFELGGFVIAAKFAEGLGFGRQLADEIGRVRTELFFDERYPASVARGFAAKSLASAPADFSSDL
jgi:hypothetical protein